MLEQTNTNHLNIKQLIILCAFSLIFLVSFASILKIWRDADIDVSSKQQLLDAMKFSNDITRVSVDMDNQLQLLLASNDKNNVSKINSSEDALSEKITQHLNASDDIEQNKLLFMLIKQRSKLAGLNKEIANNLLSAQSDKVNDLLSSAAYQNTKNNYYTALTNIEQTVDASYKKQAASNSSASMLQLIFALTTSAVLFCISLLLSYLYFFKTAPTVVLNKQQHNTANEKFKRLARYDPLTELPNRFLFQEALNKEMMIAKQGKNKLILMYLDLDHFKYVNDTLGHEAGDLLLQLVTQRLKQACRSGDIISRLGGDEFAIIMRNIHDISEASNVAARINKCLKEPFNLHGNKAHISSSIGMAVYYPEKEFTLNQFVKYADMAMYKAKTEGRNCYKYFTQQLDEEISRRMKIDDALHSAIQNNELTIFFQPQVDGSNSNIYGVEVLTRWHNALLGNVSPAEFIPVAEESTLILDLGWWMINQTFDQIQRWTVDYPELMQNMTISINISAGQLEHKEFPNELLSLVQQKGISTKMILLEITETALIRQREETVSILEQLHNAGFKISIDDFGTGYSSLTFLKDYCIDEIKIDRKFVSGIVNDKESANLVKAIISMAKILDIEIIAEGVESKAQIDYLLTFGCKRMQGFYYSKAISAAVITNAFESQKRNVMKQDYIKVRQLTKTTTSLDNVIPIAEELAG